MIFYIFLFAILGIFLLKSNIYLILAITISLLLVLYFFKKLNLAKIILCIFTFLTSLSIFCSFEYTEQNEIQNTNFIVVRSRENYYIIYNYIDKFYVYEKNNNKEEGDIIHLEGKLEKISFVTLESEFSFENYLNKQGIYNELVVSKEKILYRNFLQPNAVKDKFLKNYDENTQTAQSVLKACYEGGVRAFEFTNRGDFAIEVFKELIKYARQECPYMRLGAGTIIADNSGVAGSAGSGNSADNGGQNSGTNTAQKTASGSNAVKTGDSAAPIAGTATVMALAAAAAVLVLKKKRA